MFTIATDADLERRAPTLRLKHVFKPKPRAGGRCRLCCCIPMVKCASQVRCLRSVSISELPASQSDNRFAESSLELLRCACIVRRAEADDRRIIARGVGTDSRVLASLPEPIGESRGMRADVGDAQLANIFQRRANTCSPDVRKTAGLVACGSGTQSELCVRLSVIGATVLAYSVAGALTILSCNSSRT